MSQLAPAQRLPSAAPAQEVVSNRVLLRQLAWLAVPILFENALHMMVGLTDVYLASHLKHDAAAATAAVGAIAYILWLTVLIAGAIAVGSTAIIARAVGARHRSLANSVCGQTVTAAVLAGSALALVMCAAAVPIAHTTGLAGPAYSFALFYMRVLAFSLPFSTLMIAANACFRGAGDTATPAASMILVDGINMLVSAALTRGWFGMPEMGFRGIAIGTVAAYFAGGILVVVVLLRGRGEIRLHLHRLRPHWHTLKRLIRIGLPSGWEGLVTWLAQFCILGFINRMDGSNVMGSAHILTVRIESLSYLWAMAIAGAAATMVGQSLGMGLPRRAMRSGYLAYAVGAAIMVSAGVMFILFNTALARFFTNDPAIARLTAHCLFIAGFAPLGFAAAIIFPGALRGAGDTVWPMLINLGSILGIRLVAVIIVGPLLGLGLEAIWIVLSGELMIRGLLVFIRFSRGRWVLARV